MKESEYIFKCDAEELCKKKNFREHVTFQCSPNCGYTDYCERPGMPDIYCLSAGISDHACVHLTVGIPIRLKKRKCKVCGVDVDKCPHCIAALEEALIKLKVK